VRLFILLLVMMTASFAQLVEDQSGQSNLNKPEREEWLMDYGFGIFIHWSVDSQLGTVISHSLAGASQDYVERYIHDLPTTFYPKQWDPYQLGLILKRAGAHYVVFTTKHHSGFCMWDTETTDFNVMNTPYQQDVVKSYVDGMRKAGLAVGYYYSPEDFIFSYRNGIKHINRVFKEKEYMPFKEKYKAHVENQITELFTNYGQIDVFFNDGNIYGFANPKVWELQPNCLITRSAIPTPEQSVPSVGIAGAWESCLTMTDQWHYKPNDVNRKTPMRMIEILVETRAKGGALLLNIGPRPDGTLDDADYENLTTLAAWNFINQEGITKTRPWIVTNEGPIWFTKRKDENTVYAFLFGEKDWQRGERREFVLHSVQSTEQTKASVLGMSGEIVEYNANMRGKAYPQFEQKEDGLHLSVVRAQRIYNNQQWPYPLVVKLENVNAGMQPPQVETLDVEKKEDKTIFRGTVHSLGDAESVQVGFEYREYLGWIPENATSPYDKKWDRTEFITMDKTGEFEITVPVVFDQQQLVRAKIVHPKIELGGGEVRF